MNFLRFLKDTLFTNKPDQTLVPSKFDTELTEIAARNAERAEAAKIAMGDKYLCHPKNHVKREGQ